MKIHKSSQITAKSWWKRVYKFVDSDNFMDICGVIKILLDNAVVCYPAPPQKNDTPKRI
jgi:hypothetical protein